MLNNFPAGFINYFLSWKFFVPLSRLTYSGYLIHFLVMHYYFYVRYDIYYAQKLPTVLPCIHTHINYPRYSHACIHT